MNEQPVLTLVQKKIIKSLLYGYYDINFIFFARIHTCHKDSDYWLYSGLEGALVYCIDVRAKSCKFLLFDLKSFEIVFDFELYKKFDKGYRKGTERFYYFEVNDGFIGFEIPNMNEAEILAASVLSFSDDYIKKKLKDFKPLKDNALKEKAKKMTELLVKKFSEENHTPKMLRTEIILKQGLLDKMINTVEINEENGKLIVKGNGYKGIDNDLLKLKGLDLVLETDLKVGDGEIYTKYIAKNILRSYVKGLVIPKRKINRGEGIIIEKMPQIEEEKKENEKIEDVKEQNKNKEKEQKKRESKAVNQINTSEVTNNNIQKPPPPPPPSETKVVVEEPKIKPEPEKPVETPSSSGSGSLPPPPPPPPVYKVTAVQITSDNSSNTKNETEPIDLMAELQKKKQGLAKIEVKEYVSPSLRKGGESSSSSEEGGMMAMIMAKRNAMKKVSNQNEVTNTPKENPPNPPKPIPVKPPETKKEKKPEPKKEKKPEPKKEKKPEAKIEKPPEPIPEVISSPGGPPPPPPPPPVHQVTAKQYTGPNKTSSSTTSSEPINLAAELAAKKNKLKKVEVKEYVAPSLRKPGEGNDSSAESGNSMMAMILAKRNAMKKTTGPTSTPPPSSNNNPPKINPPTKPPVVKPPTNTIKKEPPKETKPKDKPPVKKVEPPKKAETDKPKPAFVPPSGKPPMKFGGGGFAAMQSLLLSRMAPQKKEPEAPKKPIVEFASSSNAPKMNLQSLIANLGNMMNKKDEEPVEEEKPDETSTENIVISNPSAPPPPPPPPLPNFKK